MKVVVVGVNHAGTIATRTVLGANPGAKVVAFDRNSNISFLGCGMALWIGGQIKGSDGLFYASKEALEAEGAEVHMNTAIERIDFDKKVVYPVGRDPESYDKLILATGSRPIWPPIPGRDLEGVQQVKLFQDAQEVIDKLDELPIKHVTVVGAGYIGVELAEAFEKHNKEVALVDIADAPLATYYDKEFSEAMYKNMDEHGIKMEMGQKVEEILGENGKVVGIKTDKGEWKTDMVVLCVGFRPNNELGAEHLETFRNGAYKVNKNNQTSDPDVYAVGDCATIYDNALGDWSYIALATNAVRSGIVAGHNVAGINLESNGVQGSNGISIFGLNMVSTGLTVKRAEAAGFEVEYTEFEDNQKPEFMETENAPVKIKIVYEKKSRRVIGAQIMSRYDISMGIHMYSLAIQEGVTIDRLKLLDIFFLPHFNKPYNYMTMAAYTAK